MQPQCVEKVRLRRPFPRVERCFPLVPAGLPGGKQRKETLQGKASASAAHVAGCGLHLEGFGPPNLPEGFFDSLKAPVRKCHCAQGLYRFFFFFHLPGAAREPDEGCAPAPAIAGMPKSASTQMHRSLWVKK